jgi:uncharacterized protein
MPTNPKLKILFDRARAIQPTDAAHDFSHIERVAKMTSEIFVLESRLRNGHLATREDLDACEAAALLHDCVPIAKDSPLRKESSRLSSEKAREWLTELQWEPTEKIEEICGAILDHSFSSGRIPQTLLGEALQDADRLEALGAIGLYRVIATGVSMGTALFHATDPFAEKIGSEKRELDDRKYSVDHFYTKLLKLPATFRTETAREEAIKRAEFLQSFLKQLKSEIEN